MPVALANPNLRIVGFHFSDFEVVFEFVLRDGVGFPNALPVTAPNGQRGFSQGSPILDGGGKKIPVPLLTVVLAQLAQDFGWDNGDPNNSPITHINITPIDPNTNSPSFYNTIAVGGPLVAVYMLPSKLCYVSSFPAGGGTTLNSPPDFGKYFALYCVDYRGSLHLLCNANFGTIMSLYYYMAASVSINMYGNYLYLQSNCYGEYWTSIDVNLQNTIYTLDMNHFTMTKLKSWPLNLKSDVVPGKYMTYSYNSPVFCFGVFNGKVYFCLLNMNCSGTGIDYADGAAGTNKASGSAQFNLFALHNPIIPLLVDEYRDNGNFWPPTYSTTPIVSGYVLPNPIRVYYSGSNTNQGFDSNEQRWIFLTSTSENIKIDLDNSQTDYLARKAAFLAMATQALQIISPLYALISPTAMDNTGLCGIQGNTFAALPGIKNIIPPAFATITQPNIISYKSPTYRAVYTLTCSQQQQPDSSNQYNYILTSTWMADVAITNTDGSTTTQTISLGSTNHSYNKSTEQSTIPASDTAVTWQIDSQTTYTLTFKNNEISIVYAIAQPYFIAPNKFISGNAEYTSKLQPVQDSDGNTVGWQLPSGVQTNTDSNGNCAYTMNDQPWPPFTITQLPFSNISASGSSTITYSYFPTLTTQSNAMMTMAGKYWLGKSLDGTTDVLIMKNVPDPLLA